MHSSLFHATPDYPHCVDVIFKIVMKKIIFNVDMVKGPSI